ncbi:FecR domain-containing protein [Nannocystaceae bacterium ST9]
MGFSDDFDPRPAHYGCHEFREDGERVIAGRAHSELVELYEAHRLHCLICDRHHHRLAAVYRAPRLPLGPDERTRQREFAGILAQTRELRGQRGDEWRRRASGAGIALLATTAAALALTLLMPRLGERLFVLPVGERLELADEHDHVDFGEQVQIPERAVLEHRAQSFGRIVGGVALLTDEEGRHANSDSFAVGTQIESHDESVQIALLGRLLANLVPGTHAEWRTASPELLELGLVRGTLAIRYERHPEDPILQIRTPSAIVRVVGTVFTVSVDEAGWSTVSVLRGEVEVVHPGDHRLLAEVGAGERYDLREGSSSALGRPEVAAALPVSDDEPVLVAIDESEDELLIEGEIAQWIGQVPASWTVPGLSDDPRYRTLENMIDPSDILLAIDDTPTQPRRRNRARAEQTATARPLVFDRPTPWPVAPEGYDRSALLERERKATVERALERCRLLYTDVDTRFRAARCLNDFMRKHGHEPEAAEGLLMFGVLRMDFAHDYQSASRNFEEFLRRSPDHPQAELARYKLILVAIESGAIDLALTRSRAYLRHYPDGQYLGRILQRFPELKDEL